MSAPIGGMGQEQGFTPDDDAVPEGNPQTPTVFPDDNNVLYRDKTEPIDIEQNETLLSADKKNAPRKRAKRKDPDEEGSNLSQILQDNLAAVCLGIAFSTLLAVVCIIYATGGFSESKPHRHIAAPHPRASAAVYKHIAPPPTPPPVVEHHSSHHTTHSSTAAPAPSSTPSGDDQTLRMPTQPVLTPDPRAPSTKTDSLPLPQVSDLKPRDMVVLDDIQFDSSKGQKEQIEKLRERTQTNKVLHNSFAGYVLVNHLSGAHMYYWLAEARNGNKTAPTIVWLMGGPGAPSCVYMLQAMGPLDVTYGPKGEFVLKENMHSWNEKYNMLYLDQPVGTGFSWTKHPSGFATTDEQAAGHIATAVPTILHMYGIQENPLFIFGLSYGGKMAPLVAETLILVAEKDKSRYINLQGVGIGNGWTDPLSVVRSYSFHYHARGYIDAAIADEVKKLEAEVALLLSSGDTCNAMKYLDDDGLILTKMQKATGITNWYDLQEGFSPKHYFAPLTASLEFINYVRHLLPVGKRTYPVENGGMNYTVYKKLKCAIGRSSKPQVDGLLKRGVRVLVYHGEDDGMIPLASAKAWVKSLTEKAAVDLQEVHQKPWQMNGKTVGYWRSDNNSLLSEVLVLHAGHMVAKDQPAVSKAMIEKWMGENPEIEENLKSKQKSEDVSEDMSAYF